MRRGARGVGNLVVKGMMADSACSVVARLTATSLARARSRFAAHCVTTTGSVRWRPYDRTYVRKTGEFGTRLWSIRIRGEIPAHATSSGYSAISLYCGAGGLDLGFAVAGFDIRWAIDSDPFAIETYNANLSPHGVCGDVVHVDPPSESEPTLVIGGPPCQGFSRDRADGPGATRAADTSTTSSTSSSTCARARS